MKRSTAIIITLLFITIFSYSFGQLVSPDQSMGDINSTISQLSDEEIRILESLFLIQQDVRELEVIQERTEFEIEDLSQKIDNIEDDIILLEGSYESNLDVMEEVLRSYQRKGPLSNLQLILSSDSLSSLIKRINSIRDLSRNTNELLETLESEKADLVSIKAELDQTLSEIQERRVELQRTIQERTATIQHLQDSLQALQEEKERYEGYLTGLNDSWNQVKPIFLQTIQGITDTVQSGQLPESMLNIKIGFTGISGRIFDEALNEELSKRDYPTPAELLFFEDHVRLVMPELNLNIRGDLIILDNKTLRFEITDGEYMGLALEKSAVMDLFDFGYLDLKFGKLLGNNTIRSIELQDGYMDLQIRPSLF
ncbi:coiled-coil domain-containing protein [Gudongella sp. SC589]|uniref:coiled-coil domain-containing protein n=1 Tax=Gudongella sp. SC589 TaxID=3385990 RepID=UPI0039046590